MVQHSKDPRPAGCGTWLLFALGVLVYIVLACINSNTFTFAPAAPASHQASHKAAYPDINAPSGQHAITGAPTISAAFIDRVLCSAQSPACGTGRDLYRAGLASGIDPAYALAFFQHESTYGRAGVARITLSLGNIRCTPGTPGYACRDGYRSYTSWQAGYADWYRLILAYVRAGKHTIEQIVPTYAPASENNVTAYVRAVLGSVATWRAEVQA